MREPDWTAFIKKLFEPVYKMQDVHRNLLKIELKDGGCNNYAKIIIAY
jgi:hypothetical protein